MTAASRTVSIGRQRVPIVPPSIRDPRLHTAAVILTTHIIGITALGFRVSVPQILSAIIVAAVIDVLMTLRQTGKLVWPASGMLTGSGVALILRLVEMESGSYWTWSGWHYYAAVAGLSMATKYLIRWRGEHLFNPSNVGLVIAFLVLGSGRVEPLDFWWAPLGPAMIAAYAVIIVGGVLITRRLDLLKMAVVFWGVLTVGLGVLAGGGHCMVATWAPAPVCGVDFWRVLVTSPEILVFLFFMITDPKTIPSRGRSRLAFCVVLGVLATLLIAPHGIEFGAKVGLLSSLVLLTPIRQVFDRYVPETSTIATSRRAFFQGLAVGSGMAVISILILVAGIPARVSSEIVAVGEAAVVNPSTAGAEQSQTTSTTMNIEVDPSALPPVTVESEISSVDLEEEPQELAVMLAGNLLIEAEAMRSRDRSLLEEAASGARLDEMQERFDDAISSGRRVVHEYTFDTLTLGVSDNPTQSSAAMAFRATGSDEVVTYNNQGEELSRETNEFAETFVLRKFGLRWFIDDTEDGT